MAIAAPPRFDPRSTAWAIIVAVLLIVLAAAVMYFE
jgi:hypothetical protein